MAASETSNLAQDYLDGDPSILSDEQLREIAEAFGLSEQKIKTLAKKMTRARSQIDPTEIAPDQK